MADPEESGSTADLDAGDQVHGESISCTPTDSQQTDPRRIEVVPTAEEAPVNISTQASPNANTEPDITIDQPSLGDNEEPSVEASNISSTQPGSSMPITKVQPFASAANGDQPGEKTLRSSLVARRMEILIGACVVLALCMVLGIGLGVGLSCVGKFRCGPSECIKLSAQCDGHLDCEHGEDEFSCVRLSGKSSVLQVLSDGVWRTVCADGWDSDLSIFACRQLGYTRYVESDYLPLSSIEQDFQSNLVSISLNYSSSQEVIKIHNITNASITKCSLGKVTTLKCVACGFRPEFKARIVGGNMSVVGQIPWQVSLHFQNEHLCGGSILSSRWILTAAHCVFGFAYPVLWTVYVGLIEQPVNAVKALAVEKIIYHSRYRPKGLDYDIALIKLKQALVFNGIFSWGDGVSVFSLSFLVRKDPCNVTVVDTVQPICLPNFGEEFEDGKICWISGWGSTEDGGEASLSLHSARVPLISSKACSQPEVYQGYISSGMICAGYLEGGTDSCQGDSGGPLACEDSSIWKLVGATSWGQGCAEKNKPGVYTRITQSLTWIHLQMEREEMLNPSTVSSD